MGGYAFGQFHRALRTALDHDDPAVRERSLAKAGRWYAVLDGMARGRLRVGSRTPVADVPAWATLEVVHGGFATGRLLAERPDERPNRWYLGDEGQAELLVLLESGRYRVELPEDAALPTVAWLLAHGHREAALDLVAELWPWLDRLRLTPPPAATAPADGTSVHLEPAGAVRAALRSRTVPPQIAAMRATLAAGPLDDRLVELWCDTVEGPLPELDGDGAVRGGWPCRRWPDDWARRRSEWLADAGAASPSRHPKSNAARLRAALERCPVDSSELTGRDVGWIRRAIANTATAHGAPGSPRRAALRAVQAEDVARPTHAAIAHELADRLEPYPADDGVPSVDAVTEGRPVPRGLAAKIERAWAAPVETLVEGGIIGSGDVLAGVLPQLTGPLLAAGFDDPALRRLYAQTYAAFRRRRGLLLVNLEHQVRFEELPWVSALAPLRSPVTDAARATLRRTALLALTAFPQAILPNPLVRELTTLAAQADVRLPLVEEVAADIFMGTFTRKWHDAATIASTELAGTLYARYYDVPDAAYWRAHVPPPDPPGPDAGPVTADAFAALCVERAAEARTGGGSHVAVNGATIEQSQLLTTHNLAALLRVLDLHELRAAAPELTGRAFHWLVRRLTQPAPSHHAALITVKNVAYAWRQAIFFASLCDDAEQRAAIDRLRSLATAARLTRLTPAIDGLAHVVDGGRFAPGGTTPGGGRRLLGWAAGPHWYLTG